MNNRNVALTMSGLLVTTMLALAFAPSAEAHTCRATWQDDCGGCASGTHDHAWTLPIPGYCNSSVNELIQKLLKTTTVTLG